MGNTRARVRRFVVGAALALPVLAGLLYAAFGTSLVATFVPATGGHSLTWEAVTASSNTQASWYVLYRRFGDVSVSSVTGTQIATTNGTSLTAFPPFAATWSYVVYQIEIASGALSPPTLNAGSITSTSPVTNVATIAHLNNVTRADAAGGQSGQGQSWTFTYKLNADADVSFAVYYPSYTTTSDPNGLRDADVSTVTAGGAAAVVKRILNKVPRSDRMASDSWSNTDTWDVRDSNGTLVPNGIYNIVISAYRNGSLLGSFNQTIPVDVLRITNPAATAITDTVPNSTISYNLTGNATVRILIATSTAGVLPTFTVNASSDIVLNTGTTIQILTEAKAAGGQSTIWNGLDLAGVAVSSGQYAFAISAKDTSGNGAVGPGSNDYFITGSIAVNRTPPVSNLTALTQVQNLNVVWAPSDKSATITWDSAGAGITYSLFRKFGVWRDTTTFFTSVSTVASGLSVLTYKDPIGPGTWTYGVRATSGATSGGPISAITAETSRNRFIRSITAVDGVGGQSGQGGKWNFSYKIEDTAEVDLIVLSTSALLGTDASGFATYAATDVVKVVLSSAPRAGEGVGSAWINTDAWDQTNTGGVQVSSGIYTVILLSRLPATSPYYPPALRDTAVLQVPVIPTAASAAQVQGVNVAWASADKSVTVTWSVLSGATGYTLYRKFGIWNSTGSFYAGVSTVATGVTVTTYKDTAGPGAWTYGVRAEGAGGIISAVSLEPTKNRFIRGVTQVDGTGGQAGSGGKWTFSYKLEDNAEVDLIVLSTSSLTGTDANGFATYLASDVVKVALSSGPRAGEGSGSTWTNSDVWDQTNTAGVQVSSGLYTVILQARLSAANPYYPPALRDTIVIQVPVVTATQEATQVQNLKVVWAAADKSATLTWDTVPGATGYKVYRKFGLWSSTAAFYAGVTTVTTISGAIVTYKDTVGPGAWTYGVRGEGVIGSISSVALDTSKNRFIQAITRVDGTGGDQGTGGKWTFGYKMEDDAEVDVVVLSSNSLVGTDANGFATYLASDVVKVVVSSGPRAGMGGAGSVTNSDIWDQTNTGGVQVSSGIYTALIRARLSVANPYYPPAARDTLVFQVPVNAAPVPPVDGLQVQNVKAIWNNSAKTATVTWDTVGFGFLSADTFTLYRKFGVWRDTTTFFTGASTVASGISFFNSYTDPIGPGTYTYGVRATRGTGSGPISLLTSESTRNRFVQSVTRVDGSGGQEGQGGKWTFTYSMEDDANVDILVLSSNSLTGLDANGFATYKATDIVKTVISSAPRSGLGSVSFSNVDFWDTTNNSGVAVSSGIYTVLIQAHLSPANPYYPPADRDVIVFQVPVNASPLPTSDALQVSNVRATWNPADKTTNVTWDFVNLSLGGADSYTLLRRFGVWKDTAPFAAGASVIATGNFGFAGYKDTVGPGTYTYGVRATKSGQLGPISLLTVEPTRNRFIHDVTQVDGAGGQLGLSGNWTFSYKIEDNANVDIIVLSSNSFTGLDANGFATYKATDVVRVVISSAPRAFEGTGGAWINSDNWDQKNAAGVQVSSGIYTVLIQAHLPASSPFASPQLDRDVIVLQVPVNTTAGTVSTTFLAAAQNVKVDWDPNERASLVSWDSVSGADAYTVFRKFGIWTDTTTFFVNVTTIAAGLTGLSYRDLTGPGAWTYAVRATKSGNLAGPISALDREFTRNRFIRQVTTLDGTGGQLGLGARWSFTYKIEDNANVDLIILSSNSLVGQDASGFATYKATDVVKVVVSSAPRAFQGIDNSVLNSESWDQTDGSGVQVAPGIYTVLIQAHVGPANKYYANDVGVPRPDRDVYVFQVPVNTVLPVVGIVSSEIGGSLQVAYTHGTAGNGYTPTLTWKAPVVTGGQVTYRVYRASGSYSFPISSGILVGVTKEVTFADFIGYAEAQDWTYLVEASLPSGSLSNSQYVVLPFMSAFTRADANGLQVGFGQRWKWTYKMLWDGYVTMAVYPATATYTSNTRGQAIGANTPPVKVVTGFTPRAFELKDKSFSNAETWDSRDTQGAIVPNGVYNVRFTAYDVNSRVLGSFVGPVPVDTVRVMDVSAVGISQTGGGGTTASVSYTLTGAANVRILVCKASTTFTLDAQAQGDPQPIQGSGVIVSTITFARNPGTYTEIWNGLDSTGKAVPNDLYVFALSAKDGFGNFAVAGSSNDFYIAGTIPIDRAQAQPQADITPPNVTATNPLTGSIISPFTSVAATIIDPVPTSGTPPPTGVNYSSSVIRLTGPAGNTIVGTTSLVGLDLTFTLSYSTDGAVPGPGVYVLRVTPMDNSLNTGTTTTVTFQVTLSTPVPPAQVQGLSVTWSPTDRTSTINWTAIAGASGYIVYRKFGIWTSTSSFVVGVTTVATGVTLPTYKDIVGGPGAWTYGVRQEGVGGDVSSIALETSRNRFIRNVSAVDGTGGQLGKGGLWTFSYRLEDNAVVDIIVLSSNSQVGTNANGFATYRDSDVVKNVISSAPRAAEGTGGWTNSDTWNLTDNNGQGVPQGIYTVLFQAHLSTGNPYLPPVDRDVYVMQVTIDKTQPVVPGDSTPPSVKSTFPKDQAKLPRVTQVSAVLQDNVAVNTSASSIVLTLYNSTVPIAGVKTAIGDSIFFTLAYSSDGAVATSYTLKVVPVDQALNNGPATYAYFIVDPTSPTIVSVTPSTAPGTTLNATFTIVSAKLSDLGGAGLDLAGSQITLTNPSGVTVTGTVSNNGTDTLTLTVPEQKFNGKYTVTVIARDQAGNSTTLAESFTLNTPLSATTEEFGKTVTVTQNPARAPVTFSFDVPAAGDSTFEVFNLLGERVFTKTLTAPGGGRQSYLWSLVNDDQTKIGTGVYTYRVRFTGGGTNLEAKKKLVVVQ